MGGAPVGLVVVAADGALDAASIARIASESGGDLRVVASLEEALGEVRRARESDARAGEGDAGAAPDGGARDGGSRDERGAAALTDRERRTLDLLASGATIREAARDLGVSERTVGYAVRRAARRLGVRGTQHAVAIAVRRRLI